MSNDGAAQHIGLFGGSFNPVHLGHVLTASSVCNQLSLNELRFIPAARAPFKPKPQIKDQHRIEMLKLAIQTDSAHPAFKLDLREMNSNGPSYTIDTLRGVADEQSNDHLYLIIGMDAWLTFERWKAWKSILALCHLVVMTRPNYDQTPLGPSWSLRQSHSIKSLRAHKTGKLFFITVPASRAASHLIQHNLSNGENANKYLSDSVAAYIKQHQLYQ